MTPDAVTELLVKMTHGHCSCKVNVWVSILNCNLYESVTFFISFLLFAVVDSRKDRGDMSVCCW